MTKKESLNIKLTTKIKHLPDEFNSYKDHNNRNAYSVNLNDGSKTFDFNSSQFYLFNLELKFEKEKKNCRSFYQNTNNKNGVNVSEPFVEIFLYCLPPSLHIITGWFDFTRQAEYRSNGCLSPYFRENL